MAPPNLGNSAGFNFLQLSTKSATGFWTGQAGETPAANTTSSAYLTGHVVTAGWTPKAQVTVEWFESNAISGQVSFGTGLIDPFDIIMDSIEGALFALITDSSVDETTTSEWSIFSVDPKQVLPRNMGLILTAYFQSRETATNGTGYYLNVVIPQATVRINFNGVNYQAKNQVTLNVTTTPGSVFPNGIPFGANQGWTGNETDHFFIVSDYPVAYTSYIANGVATSFITGYRPQSSVITLGATPNLFAVEGTATALSALSVTTGVATLAGAGSSDDEDGLMYETQFTAI